MSVLVCIKMPANVDVFAQALEERGEEFREISERGKAAGAIHHQFALGPDYVVVLDEWDSAENFEAFFGDPQLQSFIAEVGGDPSVPPEMTFGTSVDSLDRF